MLQLKNIVLLMLLFFAAISCKKKQPHPTDHTPKMAGVRHWHGTKVFSEYKEDGILGHHRVDSVIEYIDDSFSITVINNKEIFTSISGNSLYYDYGDDSVLSYGYRVDLGHGSYSDKGIIYYFLKDKMRFHSTHPGFIPQSYWSIDLETP